MKGNENEYTTQLGLTQLGAIGGQIAPIGGQISYAGNIEIVSVLNGFIVRVGCKSVVFESKEKMIAELSRYYDNPQAVQQEYMNKYKG